ncbi:MAG: diacylglycerol kinase family protein [Myxococcota bacterium]
METVIVANPRAAAGRVGKQWQELQASITGAIGPAVGKLTEAMGDATRLTRQALSDGADRIVAVGGDGTINEVVNGFFDEAGKPPAQDATLVVYPAGTGGDFVRSIGLSNVDPAVAFKDAEERRVDVGKAVLTGHDDRELTRYFINISSFGSSGLIVDKVNKTTKIFGGKASFYIGTLKGLLAYTNQRIRLRVDDHYDEEVVINTVAVANGRFFGGSMMVAPQAIIDDGKLDVTIIGDVGVAKFIRYSGAIYEGKHLDFPEISGTRGAAVTATPLGKTPVLVDVDGEQPGKLPVRYEVMPQAIKLLAPWSQARAIER